MKARRMIDKLIKHDSGNCTTRTPFGSINLSFMKNYKHYDIIITLPKNKGNHIISGIQYIDNTRTHEDRDTYKEKKIIVTIDRVGEVK